MTDLRIAICFSVSGGGGGLPFIDLTISGAMAMPPAATVRIAVMRSSVGDSLACAPRAPFDMARAMSIAGSSRKDEVCDIGAVGQQCCEYCIEEIHGNIMPNMRNLLKRQRNR